MKRLTFFALAAAAVANACAQSIPTEVAADRHRVALQRGPIVFCAEWPDNPSGKVRHLLLPDDQVLTASFDTNLLNGVEVISGQADLVGKDGISQTRQPFKAIPYYAWANRGKGEMAVWLADSVAALQSGKK